MYLPVWLWSRCLQRGGSWRRLHTVDFLSQWCDLWLKVTPGRCRCYEEGSPPGCPADTPGSPLPLMSLYGESPIPTTQLLDFRDFTHTHIVTHCDTYSTTLDLYTTQTYITLQLYTWLYSYMHNSRVIYKYTEVLTRSETDNCRADRFHVTISSRKTNATSEDT